MPKQYGSNGINRDGSLMNVGNAIWDPNNGGRPSIRLYSDRNPMAHTIPPWLIGGTFVERKNNDKDEKSEIKIINKKHLNTPI